MSVNRMKKKSLKMVLPIGFVPDANHVIIGRGRKHYKHEGNQQLRTIVALRAIEYRDTNSRRFKSSIVKDIVREMQNREGDKYFTKTSGGFVRWDQFDNRWYEVTDSLASEKTSQTFRDHLHMDYRSSREAKKKTRTRRLQQCCNTIENNTIGNHDRNKDKNGIYDDDGEKLEPLQQQHKKQKQLQPLTKSIGIHFNTNTDHNNSGELFDDDLLNAICLVDNTEDKLLDTIPLVHMEEDFITIQVEDDWLVQWLCQPI